MFPPLAINLPKPFHLLSSRRSSFPCQVPYLTRLADTVWEKKKKSFPMLLLFRSDTTAANFTYLPGGPGN